MSIDFVGSGSAFNTELGCTAAFYKREDSLLLIDCGSDVFAKLKNKGTLAGLKNVYVLITHLHADHVGSLATLIEYFYWKLGMKVNVYAPFKLQLLELFTLMGVTENMYTRHQKDQNFILDPAFPGGIYIQANETKHTAGMKAYGYLLSIRQRVIYYSGDSAEIDNGMLMLFLENKIDIWYQDVSFIDYAGDVHLFYDKILDLIPEERRRDFVLMHLEENYESEKDRIMKDGFIPASILK